MVSPKHFNFLFAIGECSYDRWPRRELILGEYKQYYKWIWGSQSAFGWCLYWFHCEARDWIESINLEFRWKHDKSFRPCLRGTLSLLYREWHCPNLDGSQIQYFKISIYGYQLNLGCQSHLNCKWEAYPPKWCCLWLDSLALKWD